MKVYDCTDVRNQGYTTIGVYEIHLVDTSTHIDVYCDLESDNGGWLVRISIVIGLMRKDIILG